MRAFGLRYSPGALSPRNPDSRSSCKRHPSRRSTRRVRPVLLAGNARVADELCRPGRVGRAHRRPPLARAPPSEGVARPLLGTSAFLLEPTLHRPPQSRDDPALRPRRRQLAFGHTSNRQRSPATAQSHGRDTVVADGGLLRTVPPSRECRQLPLRSGCTSNIASRSSSSRQPPPSQGAGADASP